MKYMSIQPLTTCVFVSVCVQVHKPKYSALGPAAYRSMDIILAFADYLLMVGYGVYDKTEPSWILPDLKSTSQPGAKLSQSFEQTAAFSWLKANGARYQFVLSFPHGNSQGVSYEPWHWRYEGTTQALQVFEPAQRLSRP